MRSLLRSIGHILTLVLPFYFGMVLGSFHYRHALIDDQVCRALHIRLPGYESYTDFDPWWEVASGNGPLTAYLPNGPELDLSKAHLGWVLEQNGNGEYRYRYNDGQPTDSFPTVYEWSYSAPYRVGPWVKNR